MGGITPIDLIKFFISEGMEFDIGFMDSDKVIHVNKDNIDEFEKRMEKARS